MREIGDLATPAESVLSGDAQYGISDTSLVLPRLHGQSLVVLRVGKGDVAPFEV